jgi:hypothetical protein
MAAREHNDQNKGEDDESTAVRLLARYGSE